ncbi:helix-turn-helix transcriptional regulator [Paenibacillus humicola]|uniref:helix-turn-helix transcriptional regulator n=1 Tax=Paenibacillus humicola TaxID=3110540 RepID=UPI00237C0A7D|nr:WYL domain-containing protein [Paenibacillus humicola]
MKADRLLAIMLHLQNEGKITTKALAERLEVSDRTICRDMEALSAAGIPVYADRGPHGGWALSEGYRNRLTGMTQQELLSLLLAKPTVALVDLGVGADFESAFQKVLAASPESLRQYAGQLRDRIHIDGTAWHATIEKVPLLSVVKQAIWSCRKLAVEYPEPPSNNPDQAPLRNAPPGRTPDGRTIAAAYEGDGSRTAAALRTAGAFEGSAGGTCRVVEPLGLVAKRSIWYMVARAGADIVYYRVSRLIRAELLAETFERPDNFDLAHCWEQVTEQFLASRLYSRVQLKLREEFLPHLPPERRARMLRCSRRLPDGWLEAELEFRSPQAARAAVFALAPNVEVLGPPELRRELLDAAEAIIEQYGQKV